MRRASAAAGRPSIRGARSSDISSAERLTAIWKSAALGCAQQALDDPRVDALVIEHQSRGQDRVRAREHVELDLGRHSAPPVK